jgi:choline-glycine betaine transporter
MRSVAATDKALPAALAGTALLAVGVSIVETPCTAGYPLLWADLLAANEVGLAGAVPLFALYMLVFLLDELVVFGVALFAMRATKLDEGAGRTLKLFGGVLMIALAGTLVFAPDAMTTLSGAMTVFGSALVVILVILAVQRGLGRSTRHRRAARRPGRR